MVKLRPSFSSSRKSKSQSKSSLPLFEAEVVLASVPFGAEELMSKMNANESRSGVALGVIIDFRVRCRLATASSLSGPREIERRGVVLSLDATCIAMHQVAWCRANEKHDSDSSILSLLCRLISSHSHDIQRSYIGHRASRRTSRDRVI